MPRRWSLRGFRSSQSRPNVSDTVLVTSLSLQGSLQSIKFNIFVLLNGWICLYVLDQAGSQSVFERTFKTNAI